MMDMVFWGFQTVVQARDRSRFEGKNVTCTLQNINNIVILVSKDRSEIANEINYKYFIAKVFNSKKENKAAYFVGKKSKC